jgi:hypothetical protein
MKDTKPMGAEHPDSVSLGFRIFVAVNIGIRVTALTLTKAPRRIA